MTDNQETEFGIYADDDGKPGRLIAKGLTYVDAMNLPLQGRHWLAWVDDDEGIQHYPFTAGSVTDNREAP